MLELVSLAASQISFAILNRKFFPYLVSHCVPWIRGYLGRGGLHAIFGHEVGFRFRAETFLALII